jgi:hypothetical protein
MVYACYQPPTLSVAVLREWRCGRSSSRLPRSTSLSAYRSILRSAGLLRPMCQSTSLQRHSRKTASRPTVHLLAGLAGTATRAVPVCSPFPADAFRADHPNPVPMTAAGAFAFYSSEQLCSEPLSWNGWLNYAFAHHGRDILRIFKDPLALPGGAMPACICFYCGAIRTGEPCNGLCATNRVLLASPQIESMTRGLSRTKS